MLKDLLLDPVTYTEAAEGILDCVTQTTHAVEDTFHITGAQYANVFEILSKLSLNRGLNTELIEEFFMITIRYSFFAIRWPLLRIGQ